MLKAIFNWFTGKPVPGTEAPAVKPESAPYKIETPPETVKVAQPAPVTESAEVAKPAAAPKTKKPAADKKPAANPRKPKAHKQ